LETSKFFIQDVATISLCHQLLATSGKKTGIKLIDVACLIHYTSAAANDSQSLKEVGLNP